MTATTTVTVTNMELTPGQLFWNGVDVGGTLGNIVVEQKYMKGEIKADQYGVSVLDRRINGVEISVTTEIAEVRDINKWAQAFPTATVATSGGSTSITFLQPMGFSARDNARQLDLHPIVRNDADLANNHTFFLAYPEEASTISYEPNGQSKIKVKWQVYPVVTGTQAKWYRFGTPSVGG